MLRTSGYSFKANMDIVQFKSSQIVLSFTVLLAEELVEITTDLFANLIFGINQEMSK